MDQSSALLATWMQGASISTIHFLIEQPEHVIEDQLRKALHKLREDAAVPPAPVVAIAPLASCEAVRRVKAKPGQVMRDKMAAECDVKRAKPSTPKTAPTSLVKSEAGLGPEELRGYPISMRKSNQGIARQIYEQIKAGPKLLTVIAEHLQVSSELAWHHAKRMLDAGMVEKTDERPYRLRLVARPADAATGD